MDRRDFLLALGAIGLLPACGPLPQAGQPRDPKKNQLQWQTLAPMPLAMQEIYPAVFRGRIAVAGGLTPVDSELAQVGPMAPTDRCVIYDPAANHWREGPLLPAARHHLGLVATGSRLLAIGGFSSNAQTAWQPQASVWQLSDDETRWLPGPPLPAPQAESTYLAIGEQVHVIGGRAPDGQGRVTDTNRHWRLEGGRWHSAAPCQIARNSAAAAVIDGQIYQVAGRIYAQQHRSQTLLERYDPAGDRWHSLAPIPQGAAGLAAVSRGGQLFVFGGEHLERRPWQSYDKVWRYDPRQDAWSLAGRMTSSRHGLGAVTIDNQIYVIGGAIGPGADRAQASIEKLQLTV